MYGELLISSLSGGSVVAVAGIVTIWRRSVSRARRDGKEKGILYHKLDDIKDSLRAVNKVVDEIKLDTRSALDVGHANAVAISRLEGEMKVRRGST